MVYPLTNNIHYVRLLKVLLNHNCFITDAELDRDVYTLFFQLFVDPSKYFK